MKNFFLNSFYPLCCTKMGIKAIKKYNLPYHIDGSCRREPDFENEYPCITGLCRPNFVKKLVEGDQIAYVTNKRGVGSRKLVAVLKVVQIFASHDLAAQWYILNGIPLPNNLMVLGNHPFPLDKTHQKGSWDGGWGANEKLEDWDKQYIYRAFTSPKVARCEILYKELHNPVSLQEKNFSRPLCTESPPAVKENEWDIILESKKQ